MAAHLSVAQRWAGERCSLSVKISNLTLVVISLFLFHCVIPPPWEGAVKVREGSLALQRCGHSSYVSTVVQALELHVDPGGPEPPEPEAASVSVLFRGLSAQHRDVLLQQADFVCGFFIAPLLFLVQRLRRQHFPESIPPNPGRPAHLAAVPCVSPEIRRSRLTVTARDLRARSLWRSEEREPAEQLPRMPVLRPFTCLMDLSDWSPRRSSCPPRSGRVMRVQLQPVQQHFTHGCYL